MFIPSTIGRSPVIAAPTPIPWAARREAPVTRQGTWDARHEAVLANGCVKQTELAILLVQVVRDLVAAAVVPHVLTHHHNLQVAKKCARSQRSLLPSQWRSSPSDRAPVPRQWPGAAPPTSAWARMLCGPGEASVSPSRSR